MGGRPNDDDGELVPEVGAPLCSPPSGVALLLPTEERSGIEAERGSRESSCPRASDGDDVVVGILYSQTTSGAMNMGVPARILSAESSSKMGSILSWVTGTPTAAPTAANRWAYEKWETPKSPILTWVRSKV